MLQNGASDLAVCACCDVLLQLPRFPCLFEWPCPVLFAVLSGRRPFRQCNFIDVRDPRYSFFLHPALTRPCFSCFRVTFATGIHKNLVDPVYLFTRFEPAHCCGTGPLTSLFVPAGTFCCNYQCFLAFSSGRGQFPLAFS